jgi:hypothetical protein
VLDQRVNCRGGGEASAMQGRLRAMAQLWPNVGFHPRG